MTDAAHKPRRQLILLGVCALCVILAAAARWGQDLRQQRMPGLFDSSAESQWFSIDGDGLYHTRRVERLFDEGFPVANSDPRLNSPHGAAIPWPPYYDAVLHAMLSPFAPDEPVARRTFLEHYVGLLPFWFGLLTTALLVWIAASICRSPLATKSAGATIQQHSSPPPQPSPHPLASANSFTITATLFAGTYFAWNYGAAHYSAPGIGDHHAWVSLLTLLMWGLISIGMRDKNLNRPRAATIYGAAAGAIAGLLLGSWVASLIPILLTQFAFGILLMLQRKRPRAGLAPMGFAFHIAAFIAVLPAVLSSPWKEEFPWMVVNLSWFHLWQLALGAIVFIPLLRKPSGGRFHPLSIPIGILGLIAICVIGEIGPGAGILEGMAWVSRADEFMSGIAESEPLWGSAGQFADSFTWLGYGWILLPFAWLAMLRTTIKQRRFALLIWVVTIPVLVLQAMTQRRFADALAAPMALCLAWGVGAVLQKWATRRQRNSASDSAESANQSAESAASGNDSATANTSAQLSKPATLSFGLAAIVLAIALNTSTTSGAIDNLQANPDPDPIHNAYREVFEWIGEQPLYSLDESVMAPWDQGHAIEWLTNRGSVATNFGTYVGEDSYRDPARFFLATDREVAEEILIRRKARYVVRPSQLPLSMDSLSKALQDDRVFTESFENARGKLRHRFTPLWQQTMAAILWVSAPVQNPEQLGVGNGDPDGPHHPLSPMQFLRFVRLSPVPDDDPRHGGGVMPAAEVWEYVAGANLQAELNPGETLFIQAGFSLYFGEQPLLSFQYRDSISAGAVNDSVGRDPGEASDKGSAAGGDGTGRSSNSGESSTVQLRFPYSTSDPSGNGAAQVISAEYWVENAAGEILRKGPLGVLEEDVLRGNVVKLN